MRRAEADIQQGMGPKKKLKTRGRKRRKKERKEKKQRKELG